VALRYGALLPEHAGRCDDAEGVGCQYCIRILARQAANYPNLLGLEIPLRILPERWPRRLSTWSTDTPS
jgi:hypothetical protein